MPILLTLYKLCALRIRYIISTSEDVQYKQVNHQVLVQGALLRNTFFFSIDNKKSIQGLILHKVGTIAVNMRYITAIDP